LPEHETDKPPSVLAEVEVLPGSGARADGGVTLTGDAASHLVNVALTGLVKSAQLGHRGAGTTYRLVPSEAAKRGLADGSLRWATPSNGDASVLIKNASTGHVAGHGELRAVTLSPASMIGPAAWQAMAMATQQHYLVEINAKLRAIEGQVNQLLERDEDRRLAVLDQALDYARSSQARLEAGERLSTRRIETLHDGARDAETAWREIHRHATRTVREYADGAASAAQVEDAWMSLLYATQAVTESSAILTRVPYDSLDELESVRSEEAERFGRVVDRVRALAASLHAAHLEWSSRTGDYQRQRTRNPALLAKQVATRNRPSKPAQESLNPTTAWRVSRLALPPQPPPAMLLTVGEDGSVHVAPAQGGDAEAPAEQTR
jgi:hypothetical protein